METFAKFRTWVFTGTLATVLTLGGYIWNNHVSAEAGQHATQATKSAELAAEVKQLRDIVIRLDAYITNQQELNEWFVSEHQRRARRPVGP